MTDHTITISVVSADFDSSRIDKLAREFVTALREESQTRVYATIKQDHNLPRTI